MRDKEVHGFGHHNWRSWLPLSIFVISCMAAFAYSRFIDPSLLVNVQNYLQKSTSASMIFEKKSPHNYSQKSISAPETKNKIHGTQLNCLPGNSKLTCPGNESPSELGHFENQERPSKPQPTCPDFFRWIHEDLSPWRETGVTLDMVKKAKEKAAFRLVIVNGKAYVETYSKSRYNRDIYTQWGIVQLLRRYPGEMPDLDLMFHMRDRPIIKKNLYPQPGDKAPPPLFGYDGNDATFDIVFPDWSFWGWPNTGVKPWEGLLKDLKKANGRSRWADRDEHAYWKGSIMSADRMDLVKCNDSDKEDWNARIYVVDWGQESKQGFKGASFANQCRHRYKIYMEGIGWSASEKYILACDSVTLRVSPRYYTFFSRGLMPLQHYWPIRGNDKCRSIKYAVEWGNHRKDEAQSMGKAAGKFVQEEMKMENVYDYMFHLLNGYAKLLKYKPVVPAKAVRLCLESMACPTAGLKKKYLMDSMIKGPSDSPPCSMPPHDPQTLRSILETKRNTTKLVEAWEKQYWETQKKHT
ncbi:O-glucosyltransferase rumi homolog [Coffea eugenioides]|uniref:O-glucosyltransferase rumi homolog n=1 Tax=Coffea eugenioides TaxID=49369 RepID=UPI000F60BA2C|nr:O-glucosyltransferase rumi homolog [Coffea eugenioides]